MATSVLPASYRLHAERPGVLYPHAQWWFLLCLVMTWVGFSRSYFSVIGSESLLHHVHGALMGGWILTLVAQPILYQRNRIALHRTIGRWAAYLLIPAMVVCGMLMVRSMLRHTQMPAFIVNHLAFLDVCSLIELPVFVALAVLYRRTVQLHARFIVCTVVFMMPPALARATQLAAFLHWPFAVHVNVAEGLMSLVLLLLAVDDWRKGKVYPVYPYAFLANTVVAICANFANEWVWWRALLGWVKG